MRQLESTTGELAVRIRVRPRRQRGFRHQLALTQNNLRNDRLLGRLLVRLFDIRIGKLRNEAQALGRETYDRIKCSGSFTQQDERMAATAACTTRARPCSRGSKSNGRVDAGFNGRLQLLDIGQILITGRCLPR
ncbi:hypothetical protein FQZ97_948840 [compost metagenome]